MSAPRFLWQMMAKTCYLIDGHYQIYRSFYAPFRELTSPSGEPTRATYVFLQTLFALIKGRKPDFLAMVMDVADETTFRRDLDQTYKANREPMPETLIVQVDRITSLVRTLGIPIYTAPGFEADDLLATFAAQLKDQDVDVFLVSRDKDLEQLLTDRVSLYDASKNAVIDPEALLDKKGYTPHQAVEIQTLTGDSTDNIPGVMGIGPKTAVKLINQYGSAQAVLDHADELSPKMCARVKAFAQQLPLTRQLVTLRRDVPIAFELEESAVSRLDFASLRAPFRELSFNRLSEQLETFTGADVQPTKSTGTVTAQTYHLVDQPDAFVAFVETLKQQKIFAFDTETTGLNPVAASLVGLSFCWKSGEAYYIPVRTAIGKALAVDDVTEALKPIFENPDIEKVGQNVKYDVIVLRQVGIRTQGIAFDTRLASVLLDPLARSHSLDALAKRWFDHQMIPISDLIGKGKNQITINQVDTKLVCEYAAEDADFTWRLFETLAPQMTGSYAEPLFRETEMPLVDVLVEMEHNGIALDTKLLARLGHDMGDRLVVLQRDIHKAAGHKFNIDSTKQLAQVLFDEQGLQVVKKTKTGRSTDHHTLETLVGTTDNPIPQLILAYRELAKLKSTYVDTLPRMVCARTGRVHASFDQAGAVTGRLSSRDPNLQNIPIRTKTGRQIRHAFIAGDADHRLLSADYSQIELRLLAHFCGDKALNKAFVDGQDIHRAVAAEVNGVVLAEVTSEQRSAAKAVNFGIIYGQSAFGLARSLGIAIGKAQEFIDAYFARFPGIKTFIDACIRKAKDQGYAETILGRRRPIEELASRNRQQQALGERLAVNTVVQGSAADLIKRAMIDIHRAYRAGELHAKMLVQVHDELVFDVPLDRVDADGSRIRQLMENALPLDVPVIVDLKSGSNWAESK